MNKKLLAVSLATVLAFTAVSCSNKDKGSEGSDKETTTASEETTGNSAGSIEADFDLVKTSHYGEVKLADYSEFVVYASEKEVSDETVQTQIDQIMSSGQYPNYSKIDATEAEKEHVANIDFVGVIQVDGKDYEFPQGSGEKYDLNLTNSTFIDGFAEGVVGMKVGDKKDIKLTFPEDYTGTTQDADGKDIELAGKEVTFKVTLNYLSEDLGLTDEFINKTFKSYTGATNIDEFKEYFRNFLMVQQVGQSGAFEKFVEKCEFTPNEEALQTEFDNSMASLSKSVEDASMTMDDYLEQYQEGKSKDDFEKEYKENLENMFKTYGVICALAEEQGIELTQERFDVLLGQIAAQNNYDGDLTGFAQYYEQNNGAAPGEVFPIQFLYQDVMENTIKNKLTAQEGERPTTEAATTTAAQ